MREIRIGEFCLLRYIIVYIYPGIKTIVMIMVIISFDSKGELNRKGEYLRDLSLRKKRQYTRYYRHDRLQRRIERYHIRIIDFRVNRRFRRIRREIPVLILPFPFFFFFFDFQITRCSYKRIFSRTFFTPSIGNEQIILDLMS